jgi:hypothetical protein
VTILTNPRTPFGGDEAPRTAPRAPTGTHLPGGARERPARTKLEDVLQHQMGADERRRCFPETTAEPVRKLERRGKVPITFPGNSLSRQNRLTMDCPLEAATRIDR